MNPYPPQDILIIPDEHGNPPYDALATHKPATWPVYVACLAPPRPLRSRLLVEPPGDHRSHAKEAPVMTSRYSKFYDTSWAAWVMHTGVRVLNGDRDIADLDQDLLNLKAYLSC